MRSISHERSPSRDPGGTGTTVKAAPPVGVGPRSGRKRHRRERKAALLLELAHAVAQARRSEKSLSVAILTPHFLSDSFGSPPARGTQAPTLASAVALSLPARSVLNGTAQSLLLPLMIRAAYGPLGSEPDDACGDHQSHSSGNHGPFDRFRIRARWPHSTFLAAHRWILQDETPSPVTLIAGALGGANRRLTPRQNAHAGCASPLAAQLSVSGLVRGRAYGRIFVFGPDRERCSSLGASKQLLESNGFFRSARPHSRCRRASD